jgi:hypothetical protein
VPLPNRDYNQFVRYYTTKPMNGGTAFKCTACEHSVNTLEFDHTKGNRRTQAAAAINEHARQMHLLPSIPVPAKSGRYGAL